MSDRCSPESEGSTLASNGPGCESCSNAKPTLTGGGCSCGIGPTSSVTVNVAEWIGRRLLALGG